MALWSWHVPLVWWSLQDILKFTSLPHFLKFPCEVTVSRSHVLCGPHDFFTPYSLSLFCVAQVDCMPSNPVSGPASPRGQEGDSDLEEGDLPWSSSCQAAQPLSCACSLGILTQRVQRHRAQRSGKQM